MSMKLLASISSLIAVSQSSQALPPQGGNQMLHFQEVVAFGDSLTDDSTHGSWAVTNGSWPNDPAYYKEGARRFSNGPIWIENVASYIDVPLRSFAVGGATSDNDLVAGYTYNIGFTSPSIKDQVEAYIKEQNNGLVSRNTLFVICIGSNDILFDFEVTANQVVGKIHDAISALRGVGGHAFLLVAPPTIGIAPGGASTPQEILDIHASYTIKLKDELRRLRLKLSKSALKLDVGFVDMGAVFKAMITAPERYGFSEHLVNDSCLKGAYPLEKTERTLCSDVHKYLWFDVFHPTAIASRVIADKVIEEIKLAFSTDGIAIRSAAPPQCCKQSEYSAQRIFSDSGAPMCWLVMQEQ